MPEIKLKARIQNKYETLAEWSKLVEGEFIPLKGEVCYGIEQGKLYQKIGDGETDFINLPWLLNQSDWSEYDYTSPQFIHGRPGGYWQAIDTTEKSTAFVLNYTDDEIDLSSDLGVFGGLDLTELDERLLNFPTSFDLVVKNNTYEVAKFTDIKINKPLPFIVESGLEVYYQGNIYNIIKELTGLASKEEINSLGIYDTGELYGFLLMVVKEEPYAGITFWLSPEFKTATSVEFNLYEYDFVPLPINYTNLDTSEFVGRFDETYANTKFAEIFNDYVNNQALGDYSHAEGKGTKAYHEGSHTEGHETKAIGQASHAEGSYSVAIGYASHAEGNSVAKGAYSHAEGNSGLNQYIFRGKAAKSVDYSDTNIQIEILNFGNTSPEYHLNKYVIAYREANSISDLVHRQNTGIYQMIKYEEIEDKSYVYLNLMNSDDSYGFENDVYAFYLIDYATNGGAIGEYSHAEGVGSMSLGRYSHSEGYNSVAYGDHQHVQGKNNLIDYENKYAMIIGNGKGGVYGQWDDHRSNAMTVDWEGTVTANDYKISITDEKGENNQLNTVLPGNIQLEFERFELLSIPGEQVVKEMFVPYEEKIEGMELGAEYQCQALILDSKDNVINTIEANIISTSLTDLMGVSGYEDVIVLYYDKEDVPIFINGVKVTGENQLTKSENSSLVISSTLLTDSEYTVRLIIEGPGMARQTTRYKKLAKEYIEVEEVYEEPDVITQIINTEFSYPYYALYDYRGDDLDPEANYRHYAYELGDEKLEDHFVDGFTYSSAGVYQPFYYVTEVDTKNKRCNLKSYLNSTSDTHFRIDYSFNTNYTPKVGDVLAFTKYIIQDEIKLVPFRKIGAKDEMVVSYRTIKKPKGYNKCKIISNCHWCENIIDGTATNKIDPLIGGFLTTFKSLLDPDGKDYLSYSYTNEQSANFYNQEYSNELIIGESPYLRQKVSNITEIEIFDKIIYSTTQTVAHSEGAWNEGGRVEAEVTTEAGSNAIKTYDYMTISPNNKVYNSFLDLEDQIYLWVVFMNLWGNNITVEWRK